MAQRAAVLLFAAVYAQNKQQLQWQIKQHQTQWVTIPKKSF